MTTNEIEDLLKLRKLLNNFFQDVDTEAKIDNETVNAIVDIHLMKFESFLLAYGEKEYRRGREEQKAYDENCLNTETAKYEV